MGVLAVEGGSSRHSPRSTEAAKITTVVTMETSRLSRTLKKGGEPGLGRSQGVGGAGGSHLMNLALGWMCLMRYLARALFMQLKSAPRSPPRTPSRMKKARSRALHRWQLLSPSGH